MFYFLNSSKTINVFKKMTCATTTGVVKRFYSDVLIY